MWIYIATGLLYLGYELFSGNYRQVLFSPPRPSRRVAHGETPLFLFRAQPPVREAYNPLQKARLHYRDWVRNLPVLTGLAIWKPVNFPGWPGCWAISLGETVALRL